MAASTNRLLYNNYVPITFTNKTPRNSNRNQSKRATNSSSITLKPKNNSGRLPSNQYGRLPRNKSGRLPSNQSRRLPRNNSGRLPSNQSRRLPRNKSRRLPRNKSRRLPSNQSGRLPSNQSGRLPRNKSGRLPSNQSGRLPSNQYGRLPRNKSRRLPRRHTPSEKIILKSSINHKHSVKVNSDSNINFTYNQMKILIITLIINYKLNYNEEKIILQIKKDTFYNNTKSSSENKSNNLTGGSSSFASESNNYSKIASISSNVQDEYKDMLRSSNNKTYSLTDYKNALLYNIEDEYDIFEENIEEVDLDKYFDILKEHEIVFLNNKEFLLHYSEYYLKIILYEGILLFIELLYLDIATSDTDIHNVTFKNLFKKKILNLKQKYLYYLNINTNIFKLVKVDLKYLYKKTNYILNEETKFIDKIILITNKNGDTDKSTYIDITEKKLIFNINIINGLKGISRIKIIPCSDLSSALSTLFSITNTIKITTTNESIGNSEICLDRLWYTLYNEPIYSSSGGSYLRGGAAINPSICSGSSIGSYGCLNNLHQIYDGTHDFEHLLSHNIDYLPGETQSAKNIFKLNKCDEPLFLHNVIYGLDNYKKNNHITPFDNIKIYTEEDDEYKKNLETLRINYDEGHEHNFLKTKFNLPKKGVEDDYFSSILKLWDASSGGKLSKIVSASDDENRYIHNTISIYCFLKYFKTEYDMKQYIEYTGDNIPIILHLDKTQSPKLCILSKKTDSNLNTNHFKLTKDASGILMLNEKELTHINFDSIFNVKNIDNLNKIYDSLIKIIEDYDVTYYVDIPNLSVNTCTETIKHYLTDSQQYYGKNRGKINISNIINNINNTITFLDNLIDVGSDVNTIKIKLCYMLKHSGDTMQTYVPEICNSTLYSEDQMAIASSFINNNSVITCGKLITSVDLKKLWPKIKTKQSLMTSLFKSTPTKNSYLLTYNLAPFNFNMYIKSFFNDTLTNGIQLGDNFNNKCVNFDIDIYTMYKADITSLNNYDNNKEYENIDQPEKTKRDLLLKIIKNNEKYKMLQNLSININLPRTALNIKNNNKHIFSPRFLESYENKFANKTLIIYNNPKVNLESYIIWCAYVMNTSMVSDESKYNRFLHKHRFADLELFVSIFKTQIKIDDKLVAKKNLAPSSMFYTTLTDLINSINRSESATILCPIKFLYLKLKDLTSDVKAPIIQIPDYTVLLANLVSEINLLMSIVNEFEIMLKEINDTMAMSLSIY